MSPARRDDWYRYRWMRVRFVPYGVAGWTGRRRLEFWQRSGPDDTRVDQVWLAHDDQAAGESLVIGTFDRGDWSADSFDLAHEAAIKLVNLGLPHPEIPRPDGFGHRLVCYAEQLAVRHEQWPTMPVTVEHEPVNLRYREFAGCWAGTVDGFPIAVYGVGQRPPALALVRCSDTTPYGFDLPAGVRFVDMQGPDEWYWREDWHPDHQILL